MNYIVLDLEWNQSYRGKEYSIEETQDPAGKASKGKDQGSPEKKLIRHDDQTTIFLDNLCPNVP